jgi:peptidyl-dipeptidase Dcp
MLDIIKNSPHHDQALPFDQIKSKDFSASIDKALDLAKKNIEKIENQSSPNFQNIMEALELASIDLDRVTTLFFNLYHACTSPEIDQQVGEISQKLAEFSNDIQLSAKLFAQVKALHDQKDQLGLNQEQAKLLQNSYDSFVRNGALLNDEDKNKLRQLDQEMASLTPQYSQNILKATNAFRLTLTDENLLSALPDSVKASAKEEAEKKGETGYTFTLQAPSYMPFLKYMPDRSLRQQMWMAYNTKAVEGEFSNREICQKIARLRHSRAQLLGFKNHADFVLQKRMAKSPERVLQFLDELKKPSLVAAERDMQQLRHFAKETAGQDLELMPWDFSYYSEKLKKHLFDLNDEDLRPYFPLQSVIQGVFEHAKRLYGLDFKENKDIPVYHEEVTAYEIRRKGQEIGLLYLDMFPRENKKSGAWMTNYREQGFDGDRVRRPHVSLVCNFSRPTSSQPSLLTFYEVQTLFHEFGHGLHSMLSDCYYQSLAGTNVLWDFVELPSQIFENWTYEKESLDLFAKHYQTGEAMPPELIEKLNKARNFQAGYSSVRQLSFSYVDMSWHQDIEGRNLDPMVLEPEATAGLDLMPRVPGTNFSVGFSHIFAGGYSAGYYSYKWAEVLDADAFEAFKEEGLFNQSVAQRFSDEILSRGGVQDPAVLYKNFRGREPDSKALMRRSGFIESL